MTAAATRLRTRASIPHELIVITLGVMDVCLYAPLIAGLLSLIFPVQPALLASVLLLIVLGVQYVARATLHFALRPAIRAVLLGIGIVLSGLFAVHQLLYPHTRLLRLTWLGEAVDWLRRANLEGLTVPREGFVFVLVLFLWWRGLALARRRTTSLDVAFRFRLGIVALSITTVLGSLIIDWPHQYFVFAFFFAGLVGIALSRADEADERVGSGRSLVSLGWLAGLAVAGLVVVLLAAGVAAVLTGDNLMWVARPVLAVLRAVVTGIIFVAGLVTEALVSVARLFVRDVSLDNIRGLVAPLTRLQVPQPEAGPSRWSAEQLASLRTVVILGGAALLIIGVALSLRWLRRRVDARPGGERESVWEGVDVGQGARNAADGARRWLGEVAAKGRSRLSRLLAAATIRRIYAHVTALGGERGYPRLPQQTPYEYLPELTQAFPGLAAELKGITEAYIAVHYGEAPEDPAVLDDVRAAWRLVRESPAPRA